MAPGEGGGVVPGEGGGGEVTSKGDGTSQQKPDTGNLACDPIGLSAKHYSASLVCVCVCVRACVRLCVCVCVCVCVLGAQFTICHHVVGI